MTGPGLTFHLLDGGQAAAHAEEFHALQAGSARSGGLRRPKTRGLSPAVRAP